MASAVVSILRACRGASSCSMMRRKGSMRLESAQPHSGPSLSPPVEKWESRWKIMLSLSLTHILTTHTLTRRVRVCGRSCSSCCQSCQISSRAQPAPSPGWSQLCTSTSPLCSTVQEGEPACPSQPESWWTGVERYAMKCEHVSPDQWSSPSSCPCCGTSCRMGT